MDFAAMQKPEGTDNAEENHYEGLSPDQKQAVQHYERLLDASKDVPECPASGAPDCPRITKELQQARQVLRDMKLLP